VFIQCFEATSLKRFSELTPVPLALLLDTAPAPDTGLSMEEVLSDAYLATLAPFVTVMAPWKAMLYTLAGQQGRQPANAAAVEAQGLALPAGAGRVLVNATDSNRRLLAAPAAVAPIGAVEGGTLVAAVGLHHPDIPTSEEAMWQGGQQLQTTGLTARLRKHGFLVHTYTLRDEGQFVLPTCRQGIGCEFEWLFGAERLDGGFADWPGTMHKWLQQQQQQQGQQKP
jgi:glycerophosphoryl diester phosphodiesterase